MVICFGANIPWELLQLLQLSWNVCFLKREVRILGFSWDVLLANFIEFQHGARVICVNCAFPNALLFGCPIWIFDCFSRCYRLMFPSGASDCWSLPMFLGISIISPTSAKLFYKCSVFQSLDSVQKDDISKGLLFIQFFPWECWKQLSFSPAFVGWGCHCCFFSLSLLIYWGYWPLP